MQGVWVYRAASRIPWLSYRTKLAGAVVVGAFVSAGVTVGVGHHWSSAGAARPTGALLLGALTAVAAGSAVALLLLAHLLAPLALTARALHRFAGSAEATELPIGFTDEAGRLMADAAYLMAKVESARGRGSKDPTTGLANHAAFVKMLGRELKSAREPVTIAVFRLETYDQLAVFEPAVADAVLGVFTQRLQAAVGVDRKIGQVGRDVFAAWLPSQGAQADTTKLQAIAYVLGQEIRREGKRVVPVVRTEAVVARPGDADAKHLLAHALSSLKGDGDGEGSVSLRPVGKPATEHDQFVLEQETRRAAAARQFTLAFQPVVDIGGKVVGAEALLRWNHPVLGEVSPTRFVPILERSGLMDEIGLWVLGAACREARIWRDRGLGDLRVAVNLSARQFKNPQLTASLREALARHGLPARNLEIELTETAAMEDIERTRALFGELHEAGVSVAIDDFGAGYSSMSYLKNLPFDRLKIDREFVTEVDRRRDCQAISRAIIELARGLGLSVLAEGVERVEEVETLKELGCELFQGFYFSSPLAPADFMAKVGDPGWRMALSAPSSVRKLARLAAAS